MPRHNLIALDAKRTAHERRILDGMLIAAEWGEGADSNIAWHMVALEGKWDGHWMGAFSLNAAMFDQMVQGFDSSPIDTVVDYEHQSVFGDGQSPAAGWVKALERRTVNEQQTMWARIDWTDKAASYIRANEYRYLSPTIVFNSRDRKSGKVGGARLHSVALTNTPFLHELPEVRLNSLRAALMTNPYQEEDPMTPEQFKALCKALKLDPEKTTAEQALAALTQMDSDHQALAGTLIGCREALGVAEDADIIAAAQAARVAATAVDANELAALRVQVQTLTAQSRQRSALELVRANQAQGKVQANDTDNFKACMAWAEKDPQGFTSYMATLAVGSVAPVPQAILRGDASRGLPIGDPEADGMDPEAKALADKWADQLGLTEEDRKAARAAGMKFTL